MMIQLAALARERLFAVGEVERTGYDERGATITLEPQYFICRPGIVRLEPWRPEHPGCNHEMYIAPQRQPFSFDNMPMMETVQRFTLMAKQWGLHIRVQVTERVPVIHDHSGKWKRHPPSKRKRMRSWRMAPDSERKRYAPLRGRAYVPHQWRHPDEGRRHVLGDATVQQAIYVYAQKGAPVDEILQRHSDEWCSKVVKGLAA